MNIDISVTIHIIDLKFSGCILNVSFDLLIHREQFESTLTEKKVATSSLDADIKYRGEVADIVCCMRAGVTAAQRLLGGVGQLISRTATLQLEDIIWVIYLRTICPVTLGDHRCEYMIDCGRHKDLYLYLE